MNDKYKVFINGRFMSQSVTGVQRYAHELLKAINILIDEGFIDTSRYSFSILAPKDITNLVSLKHIPVKSVGSFKGHLWEQLELPFYCRKGFLINLCNTGPILKCNQLVTIHDASVYGFPCAYSRLFRAWYKILHRFNTRLSRGIFTDSIYSKAELNTYCHIPLNKINVINLGYEHINNTKSDKTIIDRYQLRDKPFILAVSSMNPNKNFFSVIKAIDLLQHRFDVVIAGGTNSRIFGSGDLEFTGPVKCVGYVSDAELKALYEHAACFVYPSFYEGFGLPPLEAMACGCPVVVSNTTSLPEVCGDAALYCDPHSPEDIAAKINLIMTNEGLRHSISLKGLERAKLFKWNKCARETWSVIEKVFYEKNCNRS